jgi:hypothetical protein
MDYTQLLQGLFGASPNMGGLLYMDYPNQYGTRAYPIKDRKGNIISYGGEMLPKSTGWLGLLQTPSGETMTELSSADERGSYPLVVPTLTQTERDLITREQVTKEMQDKARAYRDLMQSQGISPFYNAFPYGNR